MRQRHDITNRGRTVAVWVDHEDRDRVPFTSVAIVAPLGVEIDHFTADELREVADAMEATQERLLAETDPEPPR